MLLDFNKELACHFRKSQRSLLWYDHFLRGLWFAWPVLTSKRWSQQAFVALDTDASGEIDYSEFLAPGHNSPSSGLDDYSVVKLSPIMKPFWVLPYFTTDILPFKTCFFKTIFYRWFHQWNIGLLLAYWHCQFYHGCFTGLPRLPSWIHSSWSGATSFGQPSRCVIVNVIMIITHI